jgi:hypothetical protein
MSAALDAWEQELNAAPWAPPADLMAAFTASTEVEGYESLARLMAEMDSLREQVTGFDPIIAALENHNIDTDDADELEAALGRAALMDDFAPKFEALCTGLTELVDGQFTGDVANLLTKELDRILNAFEREMKE